MLIKFLIALSLVNSFHSFAIARDNFEKFNLTQLSTSKGYTGVVEKVDNIAQEITVRIDNIQGSDNGSGVIIAREDNTYYVATAKHVLCSNDSINSCIPKGKYQLVTHDGAIHKLERDTIKAPEQYLDLAIFKFKSNNNYAVATIGKYNPENKWVFVSGFPDLDTNKQPSRLLTGGKVQSGKEFGAKDNFSLRDNGQQGLVYSNISAGGMSGGAVLDSQGRLIGIHTESENSIDENTYNQFSLGFSLGVGIQDLLGLLEKDRLDLAMSALKIENQPTPDILDRDVYHIQQQLQTTSQPSLDGEISAWMNYGNQLWRYEQYEAAIEAFEKVIELEPNYHQAYYGMGLAYRSRGKSHQQQGRQAKSIADYQQAATAFERATVINPIVYYYWRWLGLSLTELEQFDRALAAYDRAIEINAEDFVLYVERGDILGELNRYSAAIDSYTQASKRNESHPWIYNNRGNAYSQLKQYDKAVADYSKAITINPQFAIAYNNRATVYLERDRLDKAIGNLTIAIRINPNYASAYYNRGFIYNSQQKLNLALQDYSQAIKYAPLLARAYNNRGNIYGDLEKNELAIIDYSKAIEIDAQYTSAYFNRGITYFNLQQLDKAISDFTQAIDLAPEDGDLYNNRGNIYAILKQYDKAIVDFTKVIAIEDNNPTVYLQRGNAYNASQQYDKAVADYSQAIKIDRNYADAYFRRATVAAVTGDFQQAKQDAIQAQSLYEAVDKTQESQQVWEFRQTLEALENKRLRRSY